MSAPPVSPPKSPSIATGAARKKPPRATKALTERAIVDAALEVLDQHGVEGLTMRELSSRLGVALGATYRHVRSKHELLKLVTYELYSRVEPGDPRSDGFTQAKAVMIQLHDLLGTCPGLAGYMGRHMGEFGSAPLAKLLSDPLQSAGLNIIHAYEVTAVLTIYTSGHLLVRDSLPEWEGKDTRALFIFGLDLVLDGARARIGSRISPLE